MSEILNNEEGFDFMAEVDKTFKKVYIGNRVKALVVAVNKNEAVVDLGTKHSGYIPASELSQDPNAAPSDVVKVGDEIEAIVTAVNDAEGTVTLSKKKVDSVLGVEKLAAAMEANETLEGEVSSIVKGGVIIIHQRYKSIHPSFPDRRSQGRQARRASQEDRSFQGYRSNRGKRQSCWFYPSG